MNATNKMLSIIAFYLSEYDMEAVSALGYQTRTEAIRTISEKVGSGNNYLKLRRDEFDALPDSASTRKGWRNREPIRDVIEMAAYLHSFSFEELTEIVRSIIGDSSEEIEENAENDNVFSAEVIDENTAESILNSTDSSAKLIVRTVTGHLRVYNKAIITQLKRFYRGCCQICGFNPTEEYGVSVCEAHHIDPFSESQNNDASNIIILCPNHHKLIHKLSLSFDPLQLTFSKDDNVVLTVKQDYHLRRHNV